MCMPSFLVERLRHLCYTEHITGPLMERILDCLLTLPEIKICTALIL